MQLVSSKGEWWGGGGSEGAEGALGIRRVFMLQLKCDVSECPDAGS